MRVSFVCVRCWFVCGRFISCVVMLDVCVIICFVCVLSVRFVWVVCFESTWLCCVLLCCWLCAFVLLFFVCVVCVPWFLVTTMWFRVPSVVLFVFVRVCACLCVVVLRELLFVCVLVAGLPFCVVCSDVFLCARVLRVCLLLCCVLCACSKARFVLWFNVVLSVISRVCVCLRCVFVCLGVCVRLLCGRIFFVSSYVH